MKTVYKPHSNYIDTNLNKKYLELYVPPFTRDTLTEETKKIIIGDRYDRRPDLMAHELFGNSNVWWIFAHFNREQLVDPINDFVAGLEIVIPKRYKSPGVR